MGTYQAPKHPHRKYPTIYSLEGYTWRAEDRSFTSAEGEVSQPPSRFSIYDAELKGYIAFESHDVLFMDDDPKTELVEWRLEIFRAIEPNAPVQYVKFISSRPVE